MKKKERKRVRKKKDKEKVDRIEIKEIQYTV
jgi:hypothetical protein